MLVVKFMFCLSSFVLFSSALLAAGLASFRLLSFTFARSPRPSLHFLPSPFCSCLCLPVVVFEHFESSSSRSSSDFLSIPRGQSMLSCKFGCGSFELDVSGGRQFSNATALIRAIHSLD